MAEADNTFGLTVISTTGPVYTGRALSLTFPMSDYGREQILAGHEEMIAALRPGEMDYKTPDGQVHRYAVSEGSLQVSNNRVLVLVFTAESPDEIDRARAEEARQRALEELRQKQSLSEYYRSEAALARALSRLKVKDKPL